MKRAMTERLVGSKALVLLLLLAALIVAGLSLTTKPAHAADFDVTNTDGTGTVDGSLKRAIRAANDNPGPDTIKFDIPGPGVKTIMQSGGLTITDPVTIDGYSQPGSRPNSRQTGASDAVILVELDGSNAGSTSGVDIRANNVVVRGLAINRYGLSGISIGSIDPVTGARIEGNFIGTDPSGTLD